MLVNYKFSALFHYHADMVVVTLATSSRKHSVTFWRLSVCPVGMLAVTHQGAACDASSIHFGSDNKED